MSHNLYNEQRAPKVRLLTPSLPPRYLTVWFLMKTWVVPEETLAGSISKQHPGLRYANEANKNTESVSDLVGWRTRVPWKALRLVTAAGLLPFLDGNENVHIFLHKGEGSPRLARGPVLGHSLALWKSRFQSLVCLMKCRNLNFDLPSLRWMTSLPVSRVRFVSPNEPSTLCRKRNSFKMRRTVHQHMALRWRDKLWRGLLWSLSQCFNGMCKCQTAVVQGMHV